MSFMSPTVAGGFFTTSAAWEAPFSVQVSPKGRGPPPQQDLREVTVSSPLCPHPGVHCHLCCTGLRQLRGMKQKPHKGPGNTNPHPPSCLFTFRRAVFHLSLVFPKSHWLLQWRVEGQLWARRQVTCSQFPAFCDPGPVSSVWTLSYFPAQSGQGQGYLNAFGLLQ